MEIVQYIKWTTPKEEKEFLELAQQIKDNNEFIEAATKKFDTDKITVRVALLRFKDKISKVRNK